MDMSVADIVRAIESFANAMQENTKAIRKNTEAIRENTEAMRKSNQKNGAEMLTEGQKSKEELLREEGKKILNKHRIPQHLNGFEDLLDAICIVAQRPETAKKASTPEGVYGIIAEKRGISATAVLNNISKAIRKSEYMGYPRHFIEEAAELLRKECE